MSRSPNHLPTGRVTAAEVAKAAGVSQSTVSRAFSSAPGSPPKKKEHILEVARQMGYHPNAFARALAANRSGIIALIASGLEDSFLSAMLRGLVEGLQRKGLQLLVFSLDAPEQLPDVLDKLHQYYIDGMIFTSAFLEPRAVYQLSEMHKPIIMINRFIPAPWVKAICCDNAAGAASMVDHLASQGRRRIGLLAGAPQSYTAQSRSQGFLARMEELGLTPAAQIATPHVHDPYQAGQEAMARMLEQAPDLDAVFCTSDMLALGAVSAVRASAVGDSVAVAGFDGHGAAAWPAFDLTTVVQPLETLVQAAVDTLDQMLEGEDGAPPCQLFPGQLVLRGSTLQGVSPAQP